VYFDKNTFILLYKAMVRPHLEYANSVWCLYKLIRRWDNERELSLRWHRTRTTKYSRLVHKFSHRSTQLCVGTHAYQIQWNNAI